jgi:hypothetical protein
MALDTLLAVRVLVGFMGWERRGGRRTAAGGRFGVFALSVGGGWVEGGGCEGAEGSDAEDGAEKTHFGKDWKGC